MHYQNGREAKVGDSVVVKTIPRATTYNSGEFLHVEDAFAPKKKELA